MPTKMQTSESTNFPFACSPLFLLESNSQMPYIAKKKTNKTLNNHTYNFHNRFLLNHQFNLQTGIPIRHFGV